MGIDPPTVNTLSPLKVHDDGLENWVIALIVIGGAAVLGALCAFCYFRSKNSFSDEDWFFFQSLRSKPSDTSHGGRDADVEIPKRSGGADIEDDDLPFMHRELTL